MYVCIVCIICMYVCMYVCIVCIICIVCMYVCMYGMALPRLLSRIGSWNTLPESVVLAAIGILLHQRISLSLSLSHTHTITNCGMLSSLKCICRNGIIELVTPWIDYCHLELSSVPC